MFIRQLLESEYYLIQSFLYHAIYVPEGELQPEFNITEKDELKLYYDHFGRTGDLACSLIVNNQVGGLVWGRIASINDQGGYGYYDSDFIEMNIAILPTFQGQGYGKLLLSDFINEAKKQHFKGISLSVTPENSRAVKLYESFHFRIEERRETDMLMVLNFNN